METELVHYQREQQEPLYKQPRQHQFTREDIQELVYREPVQSQARQPGIHTRGLQSRGGLSFPPPPLRSLESTYKLTFILGVFRNAEKPWTDHKSIYYF